MPAISLFPKEAAASASASACCSAASYSSASSPWASQNPWRTQWRRWTWWRRLMEVSGTVKSTWISVKYWAFFLIGPPILKRKTTCSQPGATLVGEIIRRAALFVCLEFSFSVRKIKRLNLNNHPLSKYQLDIIHLIQTYQTWYSCSHVTGQVQYFFSPQPRSILRAALARSIGSSSRSKPCLEDNLSFSQNWSRLKFISLSLGIKGKKNWQTTDQSLSWQEEA